MKKFKDILNEEVIDTALIESTIERTTQLEEQFDNMLNEIYGVFDMWGSAYNASFIAKRCDPVQYEIRLTEYKDEQTEQLEESVKTDNMPENADNVISDNEELKEENNDKFNYQFLSRLQSDCEYFLGAGNRVEKYLWAQNVDEQINMMKKIWNLIEEKPEWCTMEDILKYEQKMKNSEIQEQTEELDQVTTEEIIAKPEIKEIQIIKTNFEPEVYLGKSNDKKYYLAVGTLTEDGWQPIECVDIREAFKKFNEKIAELQSDTIDEDKKAIFEECNKRWAKLHKLNK